MICLIRVNPWLFFLLATKMWEEPFLFSSHGSQSRGTLNKIDSRETD